MNSRIAFTVFVLLAASALVFWQIVPLVLMEAPTSSVDVTVELPPVR